MSKKAKGYNKQTHINKQVRGLRGRLIEADKRRHRFLMLGVFGTAVFLVVFAVGQITLSAGIRIEDYPFIAWTSIIGLMISAFGSMVMWARYARYKGECRNVKNEIRYYEEGLYNVNEDCDWD